MNDKVLGAIRIGLKIAAGISAGYLVDQLMEKKTNELVRDGGMLNAAVIGLGQGAISVVVGTFVYHMY